MASMGLESDMELSQDELLLIPETAERTTPRRRTFTVVAGLIMMCGAISFWHNPNMLAKANMGFFLGLESEATVETDCGDLPFVKLEKVVTSNLGKQGPNTSAEEGIIYQASAHHTGTDVDNLEIHVHSLKAFDNESYDDDYEPAFTHGTYVNGIHGNFACVNVKQGKSVKLRAHAYDADKKKDIAVPHGALSFFDLDTGKDNVLSVEHVKVSGYTHYFVSNETEINVTQEGDFTVFTATKEGTGDDNPTNPIELTPEQKDRAVTIEFAGKSHFDFEVGASAGHTSRVFCFVFRPSLLCAKTAINKVLFPATGDGAPIIPVQGQSGAFTALPSLFLTFGIASVFIQAFM